MAIYKCGKLLKQYTIGVMNLELGEEELRKNFKKIGVPKHLTQNWFFLTVTQKG